MEIGNGEQHNALPSFCNKCTGASKKYCFLKEALAHSLNSFIVTKTISDWHLEKAGFVLFLLPSDDFVFYESFPVNCSYVQSSLYLVVYSPLYWSFYTYYHNQICTNWYLFTCLPKKYDFEYFE